MSVKFQPEVKQSFRTRKLVLAKKKKKKKDLWKLK